MRKSIRYAGTPLLPSCVVLSRNEPGDTLRSQHTTTIYIRRLRPKEAAELELHYQLIKKADLKLLTQCS